MVANVPVSQQRLRYVEIAAERKFAVVDSKQNHETVFAVVSRYSSAVYFRARMIGI